MSVHFAKKFCMRLFLAVYLIGCSACSDRVADTPVVIANGEEIQGSWNETVSSMAVFKGIPFAAAPVGDLRWRAPRDHLARVGRQKADQFANACMQTSYSSDWYASVAEAFGHGPELVGWPIGVSEDCLYLNIWSPDLTQSARLPVMIWVHGGSNTGGWSYEPNYMGTKLAEKGVIVVSTAYRMGSFGFFSHPALDNGEGEPIANFGLLDIDQAVQWVKENISAFGGDPENIILIGESSGAGDISDLIMSSLGADSPYKKAILQSSTSGLAERRTLVQEQALGKRLIDGMGLSEPVTAEQLRQIPASDILAAYTDTMPGHYFDAVIDGLTMRQSPIERLRGASETNTNIIIGTNADEWLMYIDEKASHTDLQELAGRVAPEHSEELMTEVSSQVDARHAIDRIRTAKDTLCPSRYLASRITELGGTGRMYFFNRQRSGPGGVALGAYHGAEIPYVFNTHDDWLPTEDIDRSLTDAVMDYWLSFAKSGNPNVKGRPVWPVFSELESEVMELGDRVGAFTPEDQLLCEVLGPKH